VRAALGCAAVRVEHIGSTAVPGLAAKPIVDVLVTLVDPDDEPAFRPALAALGYERLKRDLAERDWSEMNYYADAKGSLISEILHRAGLDPS